MTLILVEMEGRQLKIVAVGYYNREEKWDSTPNTTETAGNSCSRSRVKGQLLRGGFEARRILAKITYQSSHLRQTKGLDIKDGGDKELDQLLRMEDSVKADITRFLQKLDL